MRTWLTWLTLLTYCGSVWAQSVTAVETYGPAPAIQVYNGLGSNLGNNSWEYSTAQAAHMTWGRFDCGWQAPGVEIQNLPANTSGGYTFPSACSSQLTYSSTYSIHPIVDALFGPPYGSVGTLTTSSDSPAGSTVISVTGSLSSIVNGQTYMYSAAGNHGAKGSFGGVLITANGGGTITLASAITSDLPSGSSLTLNLLLYPPVIVAPGANYLTNASVIAYGNYAAYLASRITAAGLTGQVSLWNEPANSADPWDHGANLYDSPPASESIDNNLGVELPLYVATLTPPAGVTYDNGYTEITGDGTILKGTNNYLYLQNLFTAKKAFGSESFHPYDVNPESDIWSATCLAANATAALINNIYSAPCSPTGSNSGSNYKEAVAYSEFPDIFGGVPHEITETGSACLLQETPQILRLRATICANSWPFWDWESRRSFFIGCMAMPACNGARLQVPATRFIPPFRT